MLLNWNNVLALKLIWLLFTSSGSLWVSWVHHHLLRGRIFWDCGIERRGFWMWKKLCKLRPTARRFLRCSIGRGDRALFWHDTWSDLGSLSQLIGTGGPRSTGISYLVTVASVIQNGTWLLPQGRNPTIACLRASLPAPPILLDQDDRFYWDMGTGSTSATSTSLMPPRSQPHPLSMSRAFSSKHTWITLLPPSPPVNWYKAVWFSRHVPKRAFITWLVCWDRLSTKDRIQSWGYTGSILCSLCGSVSENRDHLFFECNYSSTVWDFFMSKCGLAPPQLFTNLILWLQSPAIPKSIRLIVKLLFQAVVYDLWRERNSRIHRLESKDHDLLIKEI